MDDDFAPLMRDVAHCLFGDPNGDLSSKTELRYGSRGSLRIDLEKGVWKDHETGDRGGVIGLIQREQHCSKAEAYQWLLDQKLVEPKNPRQLKREVASYQYRDAEGKLIYTVVRFEPKDFRQFRPHPSIPDQRVWGLKAGTYVQHRNNKADWVKATDKRMPDQGWTKTLTLATDVEHGLFNLSAVLRRDMADTVYLPEGERDCQTLDRHGFLAATNSGGAEYWAARHAEHLRGADVVVLTDNDAAGRKHGQKVAASLAGIARVRILDIAAHWPECPPKGDITDWFKDGGTPAQLAEIVAALPDWTPAPEPVVPKTDTIGAAVERLNERFIYIEARPGSVYEVEWVDKMGSRGRDIPIRHFQTLLANDRIEIRVKKEVKLISTSDIWLESPDRRQVVNADYFGPDEPVPSGWFNLYRGLAIQAKPGDWSRIEWFLSKIICNNEQRAYDYLLKLIQWKIQHPTKRTEVAVALIGDFGIGKGVFAGMLGSIFGEHYLQLTDSNQAFNQYNTLAAGRFIVFYDEVLFGHDPRVKQKIKGRITESTITIEPKFVNPYQMKNCGLYIFGANEVAALPIDVSDRRVFALEPSNEKRRDMVYFSDLIETVFPAELPAFVHDALATNLRGFEKVRREPVATEAKSQLALVTGNPVEEFVYWEILMKLKFPGFIRTVAPLAEKSDWTQGPIHIDREVTYDRYRDWSGRNRPAQKSVSFSEFWARMARFIPKQELATKPTKRPNSKKTERLHQFPSRTEVRKIWATYTKQECDWPPDPVDDPEPQTELALDDPPPPTSEDDCGVTK